MNNEFLDIAKKEFGTKTFSRDDIRDLCIKHKLPAPRWFINDDRNRVGRGIYTLKAYSDNLSAPEVNNNDESSVIDMTANFEGELIPAKDPLYIRFGNYRDISKIIETRKFYPTYIAGLSGNGKTMMVRQACAEHKRELYRVNITVQTDEDDLLGGFRLVQDSTKWFDGPVIRAMKTGAILLLDEVNLASTKIMCLQPVLEGEGVFLKKINTFVKPAPGFNIIATANTKGQGDDTGKFVGTNVLNEAFLERFCATIEQDYPTQAQETQILNKLFEDQGITDQGDFIKTLVKWADQNRQAYRNDGASEVITTRRLSHIAKAYGIFCDQKKAMDKALARFDEKTKDQLFELFDALNAKVNSPEPEKVPVATETEKVEDLFGTTM